MQPDGFSGSRKENVGNCGYRMGFQQTAFLSYHFQSCINAQRFTWLAWEPLSKKGQQLYSMWSINIGKNEGLQREAKWENSFDILHYFIPAPLFHAPRPNSNQYQFTIRSLFYVIKRKAREYKVVSMDKMEK